MNEIIDHRTNDDALQIGNDYYTTSTGTKRRKMTTRGWELCVEWKDGSQTWIALKDLKASYPLELAEYAVNNKIQEKPAFAWWIPYTIKKK